MQRQSALRHSVPRPLLRALRIVSKEIHIDDRFLIFDAVYDLYTPTVAMLVGKSGVRFVASDRPGQTWVYKKEIPAEAFGFWVDSEWESNLRSMFMKFRDGPKGPKSPTDHCTGVCSEVDGSVASARSAYRSED